MADYFEPLSFQEIEAMREQVQEQKAIADQILSNARFTEEVEQQGYNPNAAATLQDRLNRFRPLDQRRRLFESHEGGKILEVGKKSEEDLAHEFQRRNPELPADRLSRLRREINEALSAEEIIDRVINEFKDPTLADEALEFLTRTTTGNLQERVIYARNIFNEENRREIVAGRNINPVAQSFHKKGLGDDPTQLRNLYRSMTETFKDHNTLFNELAEQYPFDDLKLAVAFLLQGLGYDLKSKGPSIQQAELMMLMTEVRNLQSILWVFFFFRSRMKLIRSLFKKHGRSPSKALTFEKLSKDFIKLVEERYPTVMKILKHLEEDLLDDEGKIIILTQYRDAIRQLSPRVYKSPRHRQDLLVVILEALESLEEEEEEEEE